MRVRDLEESTCVQSCEVAFRMVLSFVLILSRSYGAEFGGPEGLERTHTAQRSRARTRKTHHSRAQRMRETLSIGSQKHEGVEAADEARRGSTPR